jgi:hypothetical protein
MMVKAELLYLSDYSFIQALKILNMSFDFNNIRGREIKI